MVLNNTMSGRFVVAGIVACYAGCGAARTEVPVEGIVTLDQQPVPRVQVLFDQPQTKGGKASLGKTDEQGRFVLRSLPDSRSGATPGPYRVSLTTAFLDAGA